jgi:hypothetical protein
MVLLSSVWLIGRFPLVVLSIADAEQSGMKDRGWVASLAKPRYTIGLLPVDRIGLATSVRLIEAG